MRVALFLVVAAGACGKKAAAPAAHDAAAVAVAVAVAPDAGPAGSLERAYGDLAGCTPDWSGFDADACPQAVALDRALVGADPARSREVALRLLGDGAPGVRVAATSQLFRSHQAYGEVADAVLREQDPAALAAMAHLIGEAAALDPRLAAVVLGLAEDPRAPIRRDVLDGLGAAEGVPGVLAVLTRHAEIDVDVEARGQACQSAGELGDPAARPVLERLIVPASEEQLYDHCLRGLLAMWAHPDHHDAEAYRLSLEILGNGGPYRDGAPSPLPFAVLELMSDELADDPELRAAKPWFAPAEVKRALLAFAGARSASPAARQRAVGALLRYGVRKQELVALRATVSAELDALAAAVDAAIAATKQ